MSAPNQILIAYSTLTNNTEDAATSLHASLSSNFPEIEFQLSNIRDLSINNIKKFEYIFFGCSTWDDGPTADTEIFVEQLTVASPDLSKQTFALFGLGDVSYEPFFCASIYAVRDELKKYGAHIKEPIFTIDGYPIDAILADLAEWGKAICSSE